MQFSISTAAYDGYSYREAFQSIRKLACDFVEVALIEGYVADFTEEDWNEKFVAELRNELGKASLLCTSLACHANLNHDQAPEYLLRRIHFAQMLGTNRIILNAVHPDRFALFREQLDEVCAKAQTAGIKILFENPGDQNPNLLNSADDIKAFLQYFDRGIFGINYDPGNLMSHVPSQNVLADTIKALEYCEHLHLKDVAIEGERYVFRPIGQGNGHFGELLQHMCKMPQPPFFSIELPLRLSRDLHGNPARSSKRVDFAVIETCLRESVDCIRNIRGV